MVTTRNECCDCAVPAYPCLGNDCPHKNQKVYICDECKEEPYDLYEFDGQELCIDCIKKRLKVVE